VTVLFTAHSAIGSSQGIAMSRTEIWRTKVNGMIEIISLANSTIFMDFKTHYLPSVVYFATKSIYNLLLCSYEFLTTLSLIFAVPLPVRTPCISRYTISNKTMSSQLAALALRLQCHSCDTVCAGTGTVSGHVQIYCSVLG